MLSFLRDFLDFFFPRNCAMCGSRLHRFEQEVCSGCLRSLHRVVYRGHDHHDVIERLFWERVPIERATAYFYYEGERVRHLLHSIKYYDRPDAASLLARCFVGEKESADFFDSVDVVVALPLHWLKQLKRGYNQSDFIARGLSGATGIPQLKGVVKRIRNNPSQTHLNMQQRSDNVRGIFRLVRPDAIAGKHILLVDDVLTTGATLLSCAETLAQAPGVRISIFTLAYAGPPIDYLIPEGQNIPFEVHVRPDEMEMEE